MKAILTLQEIEVKPIHNLSRLAKKANILQEFDKEKRIFIDDLSAYYLNARYKETIEKLSKAIGKKEAKDYLRKTEDFLKWLMQKMKSLR